MAHLKEGRFVTRRGKKTQPKLYISDGRSPCCNETWIPSRRDYGSITAAKIIYLRSVKGSTRLEHIYTVNE